MNSTIQKYLTACIGLVSLALLGGCASLPVQSRSDVFESVSRADAAYAQGHWREAERSYREVIAKAPADAHAWFRLGNVQLQQGRYAAAIEAYQATLVREPGWAKVYYNLSTVYVLQAQAILQAGHGQSLTSQQALMQARLNALDGVLYDTEPPPDTDAVAAVVSGIDPVLPSVPKRQTQPSKPDLPSATPDTTNTPGTHTTAVAVTTDPGDAITVTHPATPTP
jgi:tetratricopeptide (TPR) repeat protein